jgi:hypothetical protein
LRSGFRINPVNAVHSMKGPFADSTAAVATARRGEIIADRNGGIGWYVTFVMLVAGIFCIVAIVTDRDALGVGARLLWNAFAFAFYTLTRLVAGLLLIVSRGIGWRRLRRVATAMLGVGIGYAGSVLLSDAAVRRTKGNRDRLRVVATQLRNRWHGLRLVWKLTIVTGLIASQLYLHSLLIVFPIAFLVPVVRRLWVRIADLLFGTWYWKTFGRTHRAIVAWLASAPALRQLVGAARLLRIRYLCAWRLWRHAPRYRRKGGTKRRVDLWEPVRLWRRGDLDRYVGHPLLGGSGRMMSEPCAPEPSGLRDPSLARTTMNGL